MADMTQKVVLKFDADAGKAKTELGKLDKSTKSASKSTKELGVAAKDSYAKIAAGIGTAVAAYAALKRSTEVYFRVQQAEVASAGANIGRLQNAFSGLVTEVQAMEVAGSLMNAQFRSSQAEMETVAKFMLVLRKEGNDFDQVLKQVTKSLVEANGEPLKEFGDIIKTNSGTVEAHADIIDHMRERVAAAGEDTAIAGDEMKRSFVGMQDSVTNLGVQFGELVVAMAPAIDALAAITGGLADFIEAVPDFIVGVDEEANNVAWNRKQRQLNEFKFRQKLRKSSAEDVRAALSTLGNRVLQEYMGIAAQAEATHARRSGKKKTGKGGSRSRGELRVINQGSILETGSGMFGGAGGDEFAGISGGIGFEGSDNVMLSMTARTEQMMINAEKQAEAIRKVEGQAKKSSLSMGEALINSSASMEALASSMGAAFQQMGAGQISFAEGMKAIVQNTVADVLKMQGQRFLAMGAANFFVNPALGAAYMAGGAVLMAAAGRVQAGGGGSSQPSRPALPGSAAGPAAAAGGAANSNREVIVIGGMDPLDDNPRKARMRVRELLDRAAAETGGGKKVVSA